MLLDDALQCLFLQRKKKEKWCRQYIGEGFYNWYLLDNGLKNRFPDSLLSTGAGIFRGMVVCYAAE